MQRIFFCLFLLLISVAGADELSDALQFDVLSVNVGTGLVPLVDGKSPILLQRVTGLRKNFSAEQGLLLPGVRFRDDRALKPFEFVVFVREIEVDRGSVHLKSVLALPQKPNALKGLKGPAGQDPVSGQAGCWIAASDRSRAEKAGCQVYTPVDYLLLHLAQVALSHGEELFSRQQMLKEVPPLLAGDLASDLAAQDRCLHICQNLLQEYVPLPDTVAGLALDKSQPRRDADSLSEKIRQEQKERICSRLAEGKKIRAATLGPALQTRIRTAVTFAPDGLSIADAAACQEALREPVRRAMSTLKDQPVLCVPDELRLAVHRLTYREFPQLIVLGQSEIAPGYTLQKAMEL